jgi:hypothetical protein
MDDELLQKCCVAIGGKIYPLPNNGGLAVIFPDGTCSSLSNPMLPPYVMEWLVNMVEPLDYFVELSKVTGMGIVEQITATIEQRMTAAFEAWSDE